MAKAFDWTGHILDGQIVGTTVLLKSFGRQGTGAAIEGLDNAITPLGIGALIGQETAQVHYDIQHGVPVGVAVSGAVVNGTLIVGAGVLAEPFGGPIGSAAAATTVGAILPSNEAMGYTVGDALQNFEDKLMPPIRGD